MSLLVHAVAFAQHFSVRQCNSDANLLCSFAVQIEACAKLRYSVAHQSYSAAHQIRPFAIRFVTLAYYSLLFRCAAVDCHGISFIAKALRSMPSPCFSSPLHSSPLYYFHCPCSANLIQRRSLRFFTEPCPCNTGRFHSIAKLLTSEAKLIKALADQFQACAPQLRSTPLHVG